MTLTMEPKDWLNTSLEDDGDRGTAPEPDQERKGGERTRLPRGFEVELRRKPGEGFGFVIASQDVENGKGENQSHSYLQYVAQHIYQVELLKYSTVKYQLKTVNLADL